jgi:hypothetical protein
MMRRQLDAIFACVFSSSTWNRFSVVRRYSRNDKWKIPTGVLNSSEFFGSPRPLITEYNFSNKSLIITGGKSRKFPRSYMESGV